MGGLSLLSYLFISISVVILYFLTQIVPNLVIRSSLGWLLCSPSIIAGFVVGLGHFLPFCHYRVSRLIAQP